MGDRRRAPARIPAGARSESRCVPHSLGAYAGHARLGGQMPRIPTQEFEGLQLRVHDLLAGVPLHDVWAVDLPRVRSGITLDEFLRTASGPPCRPSSLARALLNVRLLVGRLLRWDREPAAAAHEYFATRLTSAD